MAESRAPDRASLERKAALLIVLFMALVAGGVLYVLYARGAFEASQELVLIADDVEGVRVGMDLTFSGFAIGRVRDIGLSDDGSARIVVDVPRDDARWLRQSSVFTLTRGLLGNTQLKAYSGVLSDPPLLPGAERRVLVGDATAEIPRLLADVREVVRNVQALSGPSSELAQAIANVKGATETLNGPRGALGLMLGNDGDARRVITTIDRTNALLARLDAVVAKAETQALGPDGLLPELRATVVQLNTALSEARGSLKRLDAILENAQAITRDVRGSTTDLDQLRNEVEANLNKVSRMLDEVNRRWPFAGSAASNEIKLP